MRCPREPVVIRESVEPQLVPVRSGRVENDQGQLRGTEADAQAAGRDATGEHRTARDPGEARWVTGRKGR